MGACRVRQKCRVGVGGKSFGWGVIFFFLNKKQKLFKDYFKAQLLW